MASSINASTSPAAIIQTADGTGILALQTGNTTAVTIDASQNVAFAKGFTVGATAAPAFSAYLNTAQTITASTFTKVQINTEEFDTNSNYDNATNYRFTPTVAGYYQVNGSIRYDASTTPTRAIIGIYKNGAEFKRGNDLGNNSTQAIVSTLVYFNGSTDYIELWAYISAVTAIIGTAGQALIYFQASMVRSA
jgi:hypothetical protein